MDRVGRKVSSFEEARRLEIAEYHAMTWQERWAIALELQRRVYGDDVLDVREGAKTEEGRARKYRREPR